MSFIAGGYTASYGGTNVGQATGGYLLEHFVNKQLITGDSEGRTPQDAVFQGHEMFVSFVMSKYTISKAQELFWPYSDTPGVWGNNGTVGRTDVGSSIVQELILKAVVGTPAAISPAILTAPLAILAEDVPVRIPIGPTLREIEVTLRVYPNRSTGVFFTSSATPPVADTPNTDKFTAGAMTINYNGMSVGEVKDVIVEHTPRKRLITSDAQASSPVDAVYQGTDVFIEFTMTEWDASAAQAAFWPYDGTWGTQGVVGRIDEGSSIAKALQLSDIAGPTSENDPNTLIAQEAVLAEGFAVEELFAPDTREVPMRMRLYPSSNEFFALT